MLNEWALARAKIEKEISHKIDRMAYGSKFRECAFRPVDFTQKEMNQMTQKIRSDVLNEEDFRAEVERKK
jgi:hypothetical protein